MNKENSFIHEHPSVTEEKFGDTVMRTYRWETPEGKSIFLHLSMSPRKVESLISMLLVRANLDSEEVRGQGKFLWEFLKSELAKIRRQGVGDFKPMPVLHEMQPNQYSLPLVQSEPHYLQKNDLYYCLYNK